jgi:hypothetical protein
MRQIGIREDPEKQRRRNVTYMALFMLFTLVVSTVGFAFYYNDTSNSNPVEQTGTSGELVTQQIGDRWAVPFRGQYLYFTYSPNATDSSNLDSVNRDISSYYGGNLYVDSKQEYAYNLIKETLGRYVLETSKACYGSCLENVPEKNCTENIIVFRESNVKKVVQEDKCTFVDGDLLTLEKVISKILGINA